MRAARRGVDVRILMPGVPDKKLIFRMSQSFYPLLLAAGVKIYEYTPGFVHAKGCIIDDAVGTVGTVNLDYRSLFLHFENNALFYKASLLADLRADFLARRPNAARCGWAAMCAWGSGGSLWTAVLRVLSPLC